MRNPLVYIQIYCLWLLSGDRLALCKSTAATIPHIHISHIITSLCLTRSCPFGGSGGQTVANTNDCCFGWTGSQGTVKCYINPSDSKKDDAAKRSVYICILEYALSSIHEGEHRINTLSFRLHSSVSSSQSLYYQSFIAQYTPFSQTFRDLLPVAIKQGPHIVVLVWFPITRTVPILIVCVFGSPTAPLRSPKIHKSAQLLTHTGRERNRRKLCLRPLYTIRTQYITLSILPRFHEPTTLDSDSARHHEGCGTGRGIAAASGDLKVRSYLDGSEVVQGCIAGICQ